MEETGNLVNLLLMGNLLRKLEILFAQVPTFQFLASSRGVGFLYLSKLVAMLHYFVPINGRRFANVK